MANEDHLRILSRGAAAWNKWRSTEWETGVSLDPDLSGAELTGLALTKLDLSGANLRGTNLVKAKLVGAHLSGAHLVGTNLFGADLTGADFVEAILTAADLRNACLVGADLFQADLQYADLGGAHLCDADLRETNLFHTDLMGANLKGADLSRARMIATNFEGADLSRCKVYGVAVWQATLGGATQLDLVITPPDEPTLTVDNLEVAQFVYLMLRNEKIRDVINTIGHKAILILGSFTGRTRVLDSLRVALRQRDYVPIVFDFERPRDRDLTETVMTLAGMCLFVITDITRPRSVTLELQATVPNYMIPFVPIIEEGEQPFAMFADLWKKYRE